MATSEARARGNELFRAGRYGDAAAAYGDALRACGPGDVAAGSEATLALLNRAQCWLRLSRHSDAAADCSVVLQAEPGHEKALYRRACAREGLGDLRGALEDASRMLQVNKSSADGVGLMRRLNEQAASRGQGGSTAGSRMGQHECLERLHARPSQQQQQGGGGSNAAQPTPQLDPAGAADVLASLQHALGTPGGGDGASAAARDFLLQDGPCLLLCRVPSSCATDALRGVLLPLFTAVTAVHAAAWARAWAAAAASAAGGVDGGSSGSDGGLTAWTEAAAMQPGSHPARYVHPHQAAMAGALASVASRHLLPTLGVLLGSGGGGSTPSPLAPAAAAVASADSASKSAHATMHVATGCTLALLALLRASHEEQQQALLGHHREALKKGPGHVAQLRLALPREGGVEAAIQQWASMAAMLLARVPAPLAQPTGSSGSSSGGSHKDSSSSSGGERDWSLHAATLAAVAHALRSFPLEALVEALLRSGCVARVAALTMAADASDLQGGGRGAATAPGSSSSSSSSSVEGEVRGYPHTVGECRRAAQAVLSQCLGVLRETHPRGHARVGRTKLSRLLSALTRPLLADLARALPQPRAAAAAAAGAADAPPPLDPYFDDQPCPAGPLSDAAAAALPAPDWDPVGTSASAGGLGEGRALAVSILGCALLADREAGLWLAAQQGCLPALFIASASPWPLVQATAAEAVSQLASDEPGRSLLTTAADVVVSSDPDGTRARLSVEALLRRLSESRAPAVRASAAVTIAKLTGPSKAFTSPGGAKGADEVIGGTLETLAAAAGLGFEGDGDDDDSGSGSGSGGGVGSAPQPERYAALVSHFARQYTRATRSASTSASGSGGVAPGVRVDLAAGAKAVEALAMLASHTRTKQAIASSGRCLRALLRLAAATAAALDAQKRIRRAQLDAGAERRRRAGAPPDDADADAAAAAASLAPGAQAALSGLELRPLAYGLCFIVYCVTISSSRQTELKLAEMDVDVAQWRELQAMLTPPELRAQGIVAPEGREAEDSQEAVGGRVRALLGLLAPSPSPGAAGGARVTAPPPPPPAGDVLAMLASLAGAVRGFPDDDDDDASTAGATAAAAAAPPPPAGAGSGGADAAAAAAARSRAAADAGFRAAAAADTARSRNGAAAREMVAQALCNMAEWPWARGQLVAGGALPLLLDVALADCAAPASPAARGGAAGRAPPSVTLAGALAAAHAVARVLISTNPSLLGQSGGGGLLLEAIPPLLRLCRESASDLQQFEAAMALTNVASAGADAKRRLLARGALAAIECVQFSEHPLLRRAGTEALSNLAATDEGAAFITGPSRVGLWLALARGYERRQQPPGGGGDDGDDDAEGGGDAPGGNAARPSSSSSSSSSPRVPRTAAEAAAFLKKKRRRGGGGEQGGAAGGGDDTPTALAAAGGLAMALSHLVGTRLSTPPPAVRGSAEASPPPEHTEATFRLAAAAAQAAVRRLVDAGGVGALAELLLASGACADGGGLAHRAAVCLSHMALYSRGCAALLQPLDAGGGDDDAGSEEEGKKGEAGTQGQQLTCATLLALLAGGRDAGALAAAGGGAGAPAASAAAPLPPPVVSLAGVALARVIACLASRGWSTVCAAAAASSGARGEGAGAGSEPSAAEGGDAAAAAAAAAAATPALAPVLPSRDALALWTVTVGEEAIAEAREDVERSGEEL